jgi:hypothetical protein
MKELTLETLIAVFEEVFGRALFWGMVVVAVLILTAFVYVIVRDRGVKAGQLLRAELWGPAGAILAILFVQFVTQSGFSDIGGPIDVIILIAIGVAGAVGLTILAYTVQAFIGRRAI